MTIQKVGFGLLQDPAVINALVNSAPTVLIHDEKIALGELSSLCHFTLALPGGEAIKSRQVLNAIEEKLLLKGFGKDTRLIACGGGALLDMAGFLAATYCRGIALVLIPSTLLAMCDASIGGKNGLNVAGIKNAIGTIYHPELVVADIALLQSLPLHERKNGYVEMAKHVILESHLACDQFEELLCQNRAEVLTRELQKSIDIKKRYITTDRDMLNFGHTIGHAYETLENFSCSHGQAVAIGMLVEGYISYRLGHLSKADFLRVEKLIQALEIEMVISEHSLEKWIFATARDKKALRGDVRFVLLEQIGKASLQKMPTELLLEGIDYARRLYQAAK